MWRSVRQTPQAATETTTCPRPGSGGRSSDSRSGSPGAASTIAFTVASAFHLRPGRREHVAEHQDSFSDKLAQLLELPIVGDLRGTGFFYALELVKDKETRETFSEEECETLLRGFLSPRLFEAGLICRADDRGDPVVQISPPLVAGEQQFDEIVGILGEVLTEAGGRMQR